MKLLFGIADKGNNNICFVRHKNKYGHYINTSGSWFYVESNWIAWSYHRNKLKYDNLARRLNITWSHS